jgi:GT2 family glycosyltransferase/ubiquinone/menaquinone biosynthesis C-methylase UbiE
VDPEMNSKFDLMELPFDLFTRNLLIKKLVGAIRENSGKPLKILDIGGRAGNLNLFLQDDDLHILDIRTGEECNYVVGDITGSPYKSDSFDVVVSSDVYEHIVPKDRLNVISEMLRIANNFVILGAPFDSKDVQDAEIKACNYYHGIVGESHPWLIEHIKNGLPSTKKLERFLEDNGFEFFTLESNNISNWLLMQLFIFYSYKYGIPNVNVNKVYRYYNENFLELGDSSSPTYRTIYLIGKKGTLPEVDLKRKLNLELESNIDRSKYHTLEALIFNVLGQLADSKDDHIHNMKAIGKEKSKHIQILETVVNEKDKYIAGLKTTVKNKDEYIEGLETTIKNKDEYIEGLETTVKNKDEYIQNLNSLIAENNRKLNEIYNSTTWQVLAKYQRLLDTALPHTTKRRHAYDLAIMGVRLIVNDGFSAFVYMLKQRLYKNNINASKVPILETMPAAPHVPLSLAKCLCGRFTFTSDNLSEIRIYTATNNRLNSDLTLHVTSTDDGKVLGKATVKGHRILDNGYTSFRFKTIKDSKDRTFSFRLVPKKEPSAAVWYNETITFPELTLFYDNKEIPGSIGFQAFANIGLKNSYDLWMLKNEPSVAKLEQYRDEIKHFEYQPKISIVTPVYNPDMAWIKAAIESVRGQVYENWELCLADASTNKDVRECLKAYAEKDPKIKVEFLSENEGISGNSNAALALASGEYIGLLDHDDEITPDALYEVVKYLQDNRDADMIYSDEDKTDLKGNRRDPFFKPDWSRDMFLSCMYTCHFGVYRKRIIDKIGGFREKCDGSQDYDIVLRFIERTDRIHHIPKILYHWRTVKGSVATNADAKNYAYVAAKRALTDYMERNNIAGDVSDGFWTGSYRMKRELLEMPLVSMIIVSSNNETVKQCIADVEQATDYTNYEIIVAEMEGQEHAVIEKDNVRIVQYRDGDNIATAKNIAASYARGDQLLFLYDNMKIASSDWVGALLEQSRRSEVGAVGGKIISSKNKMQHCGITLGLGEHNVAGYPLSGFPANIPGYFGNITIVRNCSAVTDACMMIRKDVFDDAGGFTNDLTVAFNDVDLCLKLREKGYLIVYTPYAELCNRGSLTPDLGNAPALQKLFLKDVEYMRERWGEVIDEGDPYYSPNLTLDREDCSIRV